MKSLSKTKREPGIWLTEIDKPDIGPNDVLIEITKTAICADIEQVQNEKKPFTLG
jgi:threonine 3-dehydrogenase